MSKEVVWIDTEEAFDDLLGTSKRVVVCFTAPSWCVPCQRLKPHLEMAAQRDESDITYAAVDIDANSWAVVRFAIQSVPTLALFESGEYDRELKGRTTVQIQNEVR